MVTATAVGPTVAAPGDLAGLGHLPLRACRRWAVASPPRSTAPIGWWSRSHTAAPWTPGRVSAFVGSGAGAATAYAYCRRNNKVITDATATGTVPSGFGQNGSAQALCPPGAVALSGGFQITTGPGSSATTVPVESIGGGPVGGRCSAGWLLDGRRAEQRSRRSDDHRTCLLRDRPQAAGIQAGPGFGRRAGPRLTHPDVGLPVRPQAKEEGQEKEEEEEPAQLLSAGAFYSPFIPGSSTVFPVHTDSRIVGSGFIDRAVNGGSGTGTLTVQSQAMCF